MWRDILLVIGFVVAWLTFFGLTPQRLARYARTGATKMPRAQRWQLSFAITMGLAYILMIAAYIFVVATGLTEFSLSMILLLIAGASATWFYAIAGFLELREKWGSNAILVAGLSFVALFIAGYALSDMTLLEKIAYPVATFGGTCIVVAVTRYIRRKRGDRQLSEEVNKK